jgi:hypothetical protein
MVQNLDIFLVCIIVCIQKLWCEGLKLRGGKAARVCRYFYTCPLDYVK